VDTLTSIRVFRQVVESGSFVAAAERLDMSTAMVSKHVMNVERRLGIRLLNRSTRALSLTESGKAYFERTKGILEDLQQIELELSSQSAMPRGTLKVSCPSFFASLQNMANYLAEYRRLYSDVVVDVSFEDRNVDLAEEGYDVALRITSDAASLPHALTGRPVRPIYFVLGASREYIEHRGVPKSPQDLGEHEFVGVGNFESIHLKGPGGLLEVPIRVVMRYRSTVGVANAVAVGIGIAPLPSTDKMDGKESSRQAHVLETALTVFLRHGFRKTSMEDIAKAAGISRQGIYLHFKDKDAIFSASMQKTLDDGLQAANGILDDDRLALEEKLLKALDEWFGRHVGLIDPEASDLVVQCQRVLGDAIGKSRSAFQKRLEKVILASSAKKTKGADKRAATIANMLLACGLTWKHNLSSRQELLNKMCDAIHLCCGDL
jgi:DNA-binding transcriptional LysR family regulator